MKIEEMCRENALGPTENISTHCELHNTLSGFEVSVHFLNMNLQRFTLIKNS